METGQNVPTTNGWCHFPMETCTFELMRVPPFPKWFGLKNHHICTIHHQKCMSRVIGILKTILQLDLVIEIPGTRDQMMMHYNNNKLWEHLPQILPDWQSTNFQDHFQNVFSSTPLAIAQWTLSAQYNFKNISAQRRWMGLPPAGRRPCRCSFDQITEQSSAPAPNVAWNCHDSVSADRTQFIHNISFQSKGIVLDEHEFQEAKWNVPVPCSPIKKWVCNDQWMSFALFADGCMQQQLFAMAAQQHQIQVLYR